MEVWSVVFFRDSDSCGVARTENPGIASIGTDSAESRLANPKSHIQDERALHARVPFARAHFLHRSPEYPFRRRFGLMFDHLFV